VRRRWKKPVCRSGKAAFRNQGAALRALERIAKDNAQATAPLDSQPERTYLCECGAWHLTRRSGVSVG